METVCTKDTISKNGLNLWSSENVGKAGPEVDIVAVQGLKAHAWYTWVWKPKKKLMNKNPTGSEDHQFWPRDLLPKSIPNARVFTYSYESDWTPGNFKTDLRECGNQLLNFLFQSRGKEVRRRPLILIGHSLGGLVIQQALNIAALNGDFAGIRACIAGIIFLGAPFHGTGIADFGERYTRVAGGDNKLLNTLKRNSSDLHGILQDFSASHKDWDIVCFYEKQESVYGPVSVKTVPRESATITGRRMMYLDTDHSGLNKYSGFEDNNYKLIFQEIRRMIDNGPLVITNRFNKDAKSYFHGIPRAASSIFTGRDKELKDIKRALLQDMDEQKRYIITGMGGMGKSEISLKIADDFHKNSWSVFWVDVSDPSSAKAAFISLATAIGAQANTLEDARISLANLKGDWLLILDNADDLDDDYGLYFPPGSGGAVLMTSRNLECMTYHTVGYLAIESLGPEESIALLLKAARVPLDQHSLYQAPAETVTEMLGSHTQALIQAGAYIAAKYCTLEEYPAVYQAQRKRLSRFRPRQAQSRYGDIYATFEASAAVLAKSGTAGANALCLLDVLSMLHYTGFPVQEISFHAWKWSREILDGTVSDERAREHWIEDVSKLIPHLPAFIPVDLTTWDPFRIQEGIHLLESLSLVTASSTESRTIDDIKAVVISMHPLAHAWAKDRQSIKQQSDSWVGVGAIISISSGYHEGADVWRILQKHLQAHVRSFVDHGMEVASDWNQKDIILPIQLRVSVTLKNFSDYSKLGQQLNYVFKKLNVDSEHPTQELLSFYFQKASYYDGVADSQSEIALLHKIEIVCATLPKDHEDRLAMQRNLASAYLGNNQVPEAIALLEEVVRIRETTLAKTHPNRLGSQHELASAYLGNNQVPEAIALLEEVVRIEETTLAKTHPDRLSSQHNLASAYLRNNQVPEAIALLEEVVRIRETTLAKTYPSRLASQHALASAYLENNQVPEAIALLEEVVRIKETTLAKTHPDRLASQHELASAYLENNQVPEAIALLEEVVRIRETTLAKTHPDRLASQHALAVAYWRNGQLEDGMRLMETVVQIRKNVFAEDHPDRIASDEWLAGMQEELEEAETGDQTRPEDEESDAESEEAVMERPTSQDVELPERRSRRKALAESFKRLRFTRRS